MNPFQEYLKFFPFCELCQQKGIKKKSSKVGIFIGKGSTRSSLDADRWIALCDECFEKYKNVFKNTQEYIMCHELEKLTKMLDEKGIEWSDRSSGEGETRIWRVHFRTSPHKRWSAINGFCTYGGLKSIQGQDINYGLIELWDFTKKNDPVGWLTAEDVMRIVFEGEGNG